MPIVGNPYFKNPYCRTITKCRIEKIGFIHDIWNIDTNDFYTLAEMSNLKKSKLTPHIIPSFTKGIIQINHFFWQAAAKHSLPGPALQPTIERTQFRLAAFLPFADMSGRQRKAKVGLGRAGLSLGSELMLSAPFSAVSLLPPPCRRLPSMEGPVRSRRPDCGTKRFS